MSNELHQAESTAPVVLVTGALAGIGRATAIAFARLGSRVVVSGRRSEVGEALADELRALGTEAEFVLADVRSEQTSAGLSTERSNDSGAWTRP